MCGGFVGFRRTISGGRPYCSLPILARTIGFSAGAPPAARSSSLLAACGDGVARYPIRYQSNQGSSGLIGFVRVRQGEHRLSSRWRLSPSSGAARNPLVRTLTGPRVVRTFRRPGGGRRVGSA